MPTTIKNALKKWEEATGKKAGEAREIKLIGVYPPIEKMEGPFHLLLNCEKFSLSTNQISNISNLQAFKNLKVLSLGRNVIKSLQGIEGASDSLEQLWISYNQVDRMKPIRNMMRLRVLYMSHNYVREWREFDHLNELPCLEDLVFIGNPLEEDASAAGKYAEEVTKRLLFLKKLDGLPVIRSGEAAEEEEVNEVLGMDEIDRMAADNDSETEGGGQRGGGRGAGGGGQGGKDGVKGGDDDDEDDGDDEDDEDEDESQGSSNAMD